MKETLKFRLEAICFPHTAVSSGLMSDFITMQTPNHKPPDDRGERKKVLGLNRNIPWNLKHGEKCKVFLHHLGKNPVLLKSSQMITVLFIKSHLSHNLLNQWSKSAISFRPDLNFFTLKLSTITSVLATPAKGVTSPKG